jgi:uncharacterized protein YggT (Ycf19 family)
MKEFLRRLFVGRYGSYGSDRLCRFQFILAVIFLVLSICTPLGLLYYVAFVLLITIYFRLFSKNITKRYHENQVFIKLTNPIVNIFRKKR